jgi:ABC-type glycerol-3-phosphate transport system substrate-binding protein
LQPPAADWPADVPPRNPAIAQEQITLTVWFANDYVNTAPIRDLIADFEKAYPNIDVDTSSGEDIIWEKMYDRINLALSQGNPPDVAHGHAFAFGAQGMAEPLDDLWQAWGAESEFLSGAMEDVRWKNRYYGVPLDINTLFTFYNKRLFREANLPEPSKDWTLDDLEVLTRQLTKPGSQHGIALDASGWTMCGLIYAAGGDMLKEDNGKIVATLDSPQVLGMLDLYRRMGLTDGVGTIPPPILRQSDHPEILFRDGKVAMFFSGPWDLAKMRQESPDLLKDVGTAPLPRGRGVDAGGSVAGGGSLFVPRGAKHREAAFEFMKWSVADRYAKRMALEQGRYPVRSRLYDDPDLQKDPLLKPFFDQLTRAKPYPLEAYRKANNAWVEMMKAVFDPDENMEQLLQQTQRQVQAHIDEVEAASATIKQ